MQKARIVFAVAGILFVPLALLRAQEPARPAPTSEDIERALAPLGGYLRDLPLRIHAAAGWPRANRPVFWVLGELGPGQTPKEATDVELTLSQPNGGPAEATARARIEAGARTFRAAIEPGDPLPPDDYVVRARIAGAPGTSGPTDIFRLALPAAPDATGALLFRRGLSTANRDVPAADLRFHRTEHLLVELPVHAAADVSARLLDRTGKPLPLPVAASVRDDEDGAQWETATLALAPLAAGDYLIELTNRAGRSLVGFRVVQ